MEIDLDEQLALKFLIGCMFDSKQSVETAHEIASHTFSALEQRTVEDWYKQLEQEVKGSVQEEEDGEPTAKKSRISLPEVSSPDTLLILKSTGCIENIVAPPPSPTLVINIEPIIKIIKIYLTSTSIGLMCGFEHPTRQPSGEDPFLSLGHRFLHKYFDDAMSKIKEVLEKPDMELDELIFDYEIPSTEEILEKVFNGVVNIFKNFKTKLHVKKLEIKLENPDFLEAILNGIKPESFKELENSSDADEIMDLSKIAELEQWNSLETIKSKSAIYVPLKKLGSIKNVDVDLFNVTRDQEIGAQDVEEYVNILLNVKEPKHRIICTYDRKTLPIFNWPNCLIICNPSKPERCCFVLADQTHMNFDFSEHAIRVECYPSRQCLIRNPHYQKIKK